MRAPLYTCLPTGVMSFRARGHISLALGDMRSCRKAMVLLTKRTNMTTITPSMYVGTYTCVYLYIYTFIDACLHLCMSAFMYAAGPWRQTAHGIEKETCSSTKWKRAPWYRYEATGMTSFNASAVYGCLYVCVHVRTLPSLGATRPAAL